MKANDPQPPPKPLVIPAVHEYAKNDQAGRLTYSPPAGGGGGGRRQLTQARGQLGGPEANRPFRVCRLGGFGGVRKRPRRPKGSKETDAISSLPHWNIMHLPCRVCSTSAGFGRAGGR